MTELNPLYVPTVNGPRQIRCYVKLSEHFAATPLIGTAKVDVVCLTHIPTGLSLGYYFADEIAAAARYVEAQGDWSLPLDQLSTEFKDLWRDLNERFTRYAGGNFYKNYT